MGKGIVSDFDKRSVGSARTFVLKNADVVFLCGARLNWILHFGTSPRFNKNVKFIQLDSDPLEMHTNVKAEIPLVGDAKVILGQLTEAL
jgi:2-hydroxyacyl-CoA lyase 1